MKGFHEMSSPALIYIKSRFRLRSLAVPQQFNMER